MNLVKLDTPDGAAFVDLAPGNIDVLSSRSVFKGRGRPAAPGKKKDAPLAYGHWIVTKAQNRTFILATKENAMRLKTALGLDIEV